MRTALLLLLVACGSSTVAGCGSSTPNATSPAGSPWVPSPAATNEPGTNVPGTNVPGTNVPGTNVPGHSNADGAAPGTPGAPAEGPLELPQYPGAVDAGVMGGGDPVAMLIANDPPQKVRAFYAAQTYKGFEVERGDLTKDKPLCATDRTAKLRHCVWVVDDKGTSMIHIRTSPSS